MRFSIGDQVVHPHRGPGRIVDVERQTFSGEEKRYYVVDIGVFGMTVHVPVRREDEIGLRPAMSKAKMSRVFKALRSRPRRLAADYKERQEAIRVRLNEARPLVTAKVIRDLTWHGRRAHLTRIDSELLQRGQQFLAAEMAMVSEIELAEAKEWIESTLVIMPAAEQRH